MNERLHQMAALTAIEPTNTSQEDLLALWTRVIDPDNIGPPQALAQDISSYTAEPVEVVLQKMSTGLQDFKRLREGAAVDPSDSECVAAFYRDQFVEAYELADWHSGRTNGVPPVNYARASL